jgi:hypothetical protein
MSVGLISPTTPNFQNSFNKLAQVRQPEEILKAQVAKRHGFGHFEPGKLKKSM